MILSGDEQMQAHPTVREAARDFSAYIDRVVHHGERFLVMKNRKDIAELRPVEAAKSPRLRDLSGLLSSLPDLGPTDIGAFESDLIAARLDLAQFPPRDPWGS